ncbi:MAG: carbohydrate ABC transporter substrate-binding protein [Clostridia bacterium]|nr:carbohydrate ABC transporter substrate-binding protein [Clostridia bacterium]
MKKRILSGLLVLLMAAFPLYLSGCGKDETKAVYLSVGSKTQSGFFEEAAKLYREETGKSVEIKNEEIKTNKETAIFVIESNAEYEKIKNDCYDLSASKINSYLIDKRLAKRGDGDNKVFAVPYEITGYGIIYNKALTDKFFEKNKDSERLVSMNEVRDFKSLKDLAEEIDKQKSELGIETVFASPSLKAEDAYEWHSEMLNAPFYYEFSANDDYTDPDDAFYNSKEIDFRYDKEYKDTLDLIIGKTTDKKLFETKSSDASITEFAEGKSAMLLGSDKIYEILSKKIGNKISSKDLRFLPLYTDISGNNDQGITVKRERYIALNKNADKEARDSALEFIDWLFSSKNGKKFVSGNMGILTPFDTFKDDELPDNPLMKETKRYLEDKTVENVLWVITEPVKEVTKSGVSLAANAYIAGEKAFDDLKAGIKDLMKKDNR